MNQFKIELDWKSLFPITHSVARLLLTFLSWTGFRQILLVTPHNTQKKKEEEKKEQSRDLHARGGPPGLHDDIRSGFNTHPVPNPARKGLT